MVEGGASGLAECVVLRWSGQHRGVTQGHSYNALPLISQVSDPVAGVVIVIVIVMQDHRTNIHQLLLKIRSRYSQSPSQIYTIL